MLNDITRLLRESILDEYDAVTEPTHRRIVAYALRKVSHCQDWTPRHFWDTHGNAFPPLVRRVSRAWFQRCCGERVARYRITEQRVTPTGVIKPMDACEVRACHVCGELIVWTDG